LPFVGILPTLNLTWGKLKKKGKPSGLSRPAVFFVLFLQSQPVAVWRLRKQSKKTLKKIGEKLDNGNPLRYVLGILATTTNQKGN
jgi:hypothetical protein